MSGNFHVLADRFAAEAAAPAATAAGNVFLIADSDFLYNDFAYRRRDPTKAG